MFNIKTNVSMIIMKYGIKCFYGYPKKTVGNVSVYYEKWWEMFLCL